MITEMTCVIIPAIIRDHEFAHDRGTSHGQGSCRRSVVRGAACDMNTGMAVIYLLRHGETDYRQVRERNWPGLAFDLSPLSDLGVAQAQEAAEQLTAVGATAIVSSPMTRALQTAAIVGHRLGFGVDVQFDLREWLPDDGLSWTTYAEVRAAMTDLVECGGEWPPGERRLWEPLSDLRARATAALRATLAKLDDDAILIAACHGVLIWSLTGEEHTPTAHWRRFELS
jgi:broad specificity phosphatase PhoE